MHYAYPFAYHEYYIFCIYLYMHACKKCRICTYMRDEVWALLEVGGEVRAGVGRAVVVWGLPPQSGSAPGCESAGRGRRNDVSN